MRDYLAWGFKLWTAMVSRAAVAAATEARIKMSRLMGMGKLVVGVVWRKMLVRSR